MNVLVLTWALRELTPFALKHLFRVYRQMYDRDLNNSRFCFIIY